MKKKLTRRKFLETGFKGSIALGGAALVGITAAPMGPVANGLQEKPSKSAFNPHEKELLRAAMDEIVPAGDGMPAASGVGGVEYLERVAAENPEIRKQLAGSLAKLEKLSQMSFKKCFLSITNAARVKVLAQLEQDAAPEAFSNLRDYVYEAYYTQPKIWELVGYEFYPTNDAGPVMKPFDEAVLAQVRKKSKLYREVS